MEAFEKLKLLSSQMEFEPAEDEGCPPLLSGKGIVSQAVGPGGRAMRLLKSLQTSACERNCFYCPFRAGRDFRRATLQPDEMAASFMALARSGAAEGLFLSSGIAGGGVRTQDKILATAEILRQKFHFNGYLHLKIMPGAERAQVERAMQLADRVSINLEAPNTDRLQQLAPRKTFFQELFQPLGWIEEIRRTQDPHRYGKAFWPSSTTQFVVGAAGESDLELLATTARLYSQFKLRRAYFSAFRPISDTPLENLPAENPARQLRLYQASFLLRDYGFDLEDLVFQDSGSLPLSQDPKLAWAEQNLSENPVDLNRANPQELLKVPGIGPQAVQHILQARRQNPLRQVEDLRKLGLLAERMLPYIVLDGKRPTHQLRLL